MHLFILILSFSYFIFKYIKEYILTEKIYNLLAIVPIVGAIIMEIFFTNNINRTLEIIISISLFIFYLIVIYIGSRKHT